MSLTLYLIFILCVVLRTLLYSLPLFVDYPFVWSPNFWSLLMLSLWDETISICADFLYRGPSVASLLFLRLFSLNWRALPQGRCRSALMRLCFVKLRVLVWDPLQAPFWRLFFFGFHERRLFGKFPEPFTYLRYVDDTFVSFKSRSDALKFFDMYIYYIYIYPRRATKYYFEFFCHWIPFIFPQYYLMSCPGHSLGKSYLPAKM